VDQGNLIMMLLYGMGGEMYEKQVSLLM